MREFASVTDLFESEVQSNATFNPLFEDDDSDDNLRRRYTRHWLYTIDEESYKCMIPARDYVLFVLPA